MLHGKFESMKAIYAMLLGFEPKPIAYGAHDNIPDLHFFPCEFREMTGDMLDPRQVYRFSCSFASKQQVLNS